MGVVPQCENNVSVHALTVDFTMLYFVVCLAFQCWCCAVVNI